MKQTVHCIMLLLFWATLTTCQNKPAKILDEVGVLEPEKEKAVFLMPGHNGLYVSQTKNNSESVGAVVMNLRFVSRLPIAGHSIFRRKHPKLTEQIIFARETPFILCQSPSYSVRKIYFQTYSDGKWSNIKTANVRGTSFFTIRVSDEVERFKVSKVQFK